MGLSARRGAGSCPTRRTARAAHTICHARVCRPCSDGAHIRGRYFTGLPAGLQDRLCPVAVVEDDGCRSASFPRARRYFLSVVDAACHRRYEARGNHRRYSAHAAGSGDHRLARGTWIEAASKRTKLSWVRISRESRRVASSGGPEDEVTAETLL